MSGKTDSDREQLAAVNILFGPFPEEYARGLDTLSPDIFEFNDTTVVVRYPPDKDSMSDPDHASALRRLELLQPISVSSTCG